MLRCSVESQYTEDPYYDRDQGEGKEPEVGGGGWFSMRTL